VELPKNIVEKCKKGDGKAQHMLYQFYSSSMYGVCLRYFPNADIAKDILQEGFVKVFDSIRSFRFDGSLEGWIRRIMVNTALEYHRKSKTDIEVDINEAVPLHGSDEGVGADYQLLLSIVSDLPNQYRLVFNLYAIEGYSHAEIGKKLGISESTSKSNYSRAKNILREKLVRIRKLDRYAFL
jgi:RNA polymerase sigma-70 factor (ECF subfamily)